jgi:hypothetical protein
MKHATGATPPDLKGAFQEIETFATLDYFLCWPLHHTEVAEHSKCGSFLPWSLALSSKSPMSTPPGHATP